MRKPKRPPIGFRPPEQVSEVVAIDDLAKELRASKPTIYRACKLYRVSRGREGLPHSKVGRCFLFRRAAVARWLAGLEEACHA